MGGRDDEDENKEEKKKLLFFWIELAEQLVANPYLLIRDEQEGDADGGAVITNRRSKRVRMELDHDDAVAPQYEKNHNGSWILTDKCALQRKTCATPGCSERMRSFCTCFIGQWMCVKCYGNHRKEVAINNYIP